MDDDTHEVWRQGVAVDLTATEFNLLRYLLENSRRVLSKSEIVDNVWSFDFDGDPNIVETYISYLRKKVDCVEPPLIHTIRGVGYSLRVAREREADGS
jgi:two-component system OmpR family response regulator